ncbi:hypothetical protein MTO96_020214 [Rhipicephalus appendiculatus]
MSSSYFKKLEAEAQGRYRAKLSFGGDKLPDPFDDDAEIAPNTLLLSSLTDSEDTDSAPETTTQDPARSAGRQQLSVPLGEIYKNADLETAKRVQLTFESCCEIEEATRDQAKSPRWLKEQVAREKQDTSDWLDELGARNKKGKVPFGRRRDGRVSMRNRLGGVDERPSRTAVADVT